MSEITEDWYNHQIAIVNKRNQELESQLSKMDWQSITPENLPKIGDEVGGWFGVFDPQWEVRPFRWPMPSSESLKPEIIHEGCKVAGWKYFRPMNAVEVKDQGRV